MSKIFDRITGYTKIETSGAMPEELINLCVRQGAPVIDCVPVDEYTFSLKVSAKNKERVREILERGGYETKTLKGVGLPFFAKSLKRRAALFAGLIAALCLLAASSLYIWDIEVSGNDKVTVSEILYALESCGVNYGSFWPGINENNLRNQMIELIPELSFLSVKIHGSHAEIVVREKTPTPEIYDDKAPKDIVASVGGIILEVRAYEGVSKVIKGQTVLPGQLLVSGRADSFSGARLEHARADIFARTWYEITACAPLSETKKSYTGQEKKIFAMVLGEKRINLFAGTGNTYIDYDKIASEKRLAIAGAFALPLKLVSESYSEYSLYTVPLDVNTVQAYLEQRLLSELYGRLSPGGAITSHTYTKLAKDGSLYVTIHAECMENIAKEAEISYYYE